MTYYGLAREKLVNKYPRLLSVLVILALICMTGLALFIISDLVSFASNPDHKGVSVGLDLKGPEKGIVPMTNGNEDSGNKSGNTSTNSSRHAELEQSNQIECVTAIQSGCKRSRCCKQIISRYKTS